MRPGLRRVFFIGEGDFPLSYKINDLVAVHFEKRHENVRQSLASQIFGWLNK